MPVYYKTFQCISSEKNNSWPTVFDSVVCFYNGRCGEFFFKWKRPAGIVPTRTLSVKTTHKPVCVCVCVGVWACVFLLGSVGEIQLFSDLFIHNCGHLSDVPKRATSACYVMQCAFWMSGMHTHFSFPSFCVNSIYAHAEGVTCRNICHVLMWKV